MELQNIPIRVSLFISPKILIKLFFFQSWIVHRSISIKLSLHHLCLIISPWEVHNYCHYHRYIWTSIHAFVHYCLVYLIFSIFTPWHHILVYVYFVLTMIFMIFFFTHRTFFLLRQRGPNDWEMCIYLLSHAWKSRVVFWKIWNVSMVTISSPPIRLPDTNTHVVNSVVLAD